jgi:hypothetical protein
MCSCGTTTAAYSRRGNCFGRSRTARRTEGRDIVERPVATCLPPQLTSVAHLNLDG